MHAINRRSFLCSQRAAKCAFQLEQAAFDVEAAAITAESSIGGNDAMARDNDRDGVAIVRHAHGAESLRAADRASDVAIRSGLAIGNREQSSPAGELEFGAAEIERELEFAAFTGEVFFQLANISAHLRRRIFKAKRFAFYS